MVQSGSICGLDAADDRMETGIFVNYRSEVQRIHNDLERRGSDSSDDTKQLRQQGGPTLRILSVYQSGFGIGFGGRKKADVRHPLSNANVPNQEQEVSNEGGALRTGDQSPHRLHQEHQLVSASGFPSVVTA